MKAVFVFLALLVLLTPTVRAYSVTGMVGATISNTIFVFKNGLNQIQVWIFEYILHNSEAVDAIQKQMKNEGIMNIFYNDKFEGTCYNFEYYIEGRFIGEEDCEEVEEKLKVALGV